MKVALCRRAAASARSTFNVNKQRKGPRGQIKSNAERRIASFADRRSAYECLCGRESAGDASDSQLRAGERRVLHAINFIKRNAMLNTYGCSQLQNQKRTYTHTHTRARRRHTSRRNARPRKTGGFEEPKTQERREKPRHTYYIDSRIASQAHSQLAVCAECSARAPPSELGSAIPFVRSNI